MVQRYADVSHHQEHVDLAAYARAGHDRIALKATEGSSFVDPLFAARHRQAASLRLGRIAYHFAQTETSGAAQADHLLATVAAAGGLGARDVLCLDVEDNDSDLARARADEFAGEFCWRMVERGHPTGQLYTGRWYADPCNIRPDDLPPGWRRLWLSNYTTATDAAMTLPAGWSRSQVVARQYTSTADVAGVAGPSDYSRILIDWLEDDVAAPDVWAYKIPVGPYERDIPHARTAYSAGEYLSGANYWGAKTYRELTAMRATINTLAGLLAKANGLNVDQVTQAVQDALADATVHVDVTVEGTPIQEQEPSE